MHAAIYLMMLPVSKPANQPPSPCTILMGPVWKPSPLRMVRWCNNRGGEKAGRTSLEFVDCQRKIQSRGTYHSWDLELVESDHLPASQYQVCSELAGAWQAGRVGEA